jgi:hypothetical protein
MEHNTSIQIVYQALAKYISFTIPNEHLVSEKYTYKKQITDFLGNSICDMGDCTCTHAPTTLSSRTTICTVPATTTMGRRDVRNDVVVDCKRALSV